MNIAIIPARGGSKRIPRKNIKEFAGRPMIAWSIEAAIKSDCFDRVVVSTDDEEIAQVAVELGAEAPFLRPAELSNDMVGTTPVISHAISWYQSQGLVVDNACCIYATAPFVCVDDILKGFELINGVKGYSYVFSATSFSYPIQRAVRLIKSDGVEMFNPDLYLARSQDLEEAYHDAGQFYWGKASAWLDDKPIFSKESGVVILPRYRVQDIDTYEDWKCAELIFKVIQNEQHN